MASKNVEAHRAAHEAWNRRDYDAVIGGMVEDFTYTDHPRGLTVKSRGELGDWTREWAAALPDGRITDARYIDGGDTTVALFVGRGTNDGPFGPYPATGRRVSWPLCEVIRFDDQGRIVSGEIFYDTLSVLIQLGHAQPPA